MSKSKNTELPEKSIQRLPSIPSRGIYTEKARMERLQFAVEQTGCETGVLEKTLLVPERLTGNIENLISSVEIPVGLVGPLKFCGDSINEIIFAPFATTEGALVASACRGAKAISESGGVTSHSFGQRMVRTPLFVMTDVHGAIIFAEWLRNHLKELQTQIDRFSKRAKLIQIDPIVLGRMVHVNFIYETGDAAGQNMTTTTTWHACQWATQAMKSFDQVQFDNFVIEANMSSDKKVSFKSFIEGRGTRVISEAFVRDDILTRILKINTDQLMTIFSNFSAGSIESGTIGSNVNISNVIAAIFTATGQDIACVHESSVGHFQLQQVSGGIFASMHLPSLVVGTVGGGTHISKQNHYLEMMGCNGLGKINRLAEIIAGFCLALDLSTLSSIANGTFAVSHEKLGRNKPVDWFARKDLTAQFFSKLLKKTPEHENSIVKRIESIDDFEIGSSIITELTSRKVEKLVGHFPFNLIVDTNNKANTEQLIEVMVKIKPIDGEIMLMLNSFAGMCGQLLGSNYIKFGAKTGFAKTHTKELEINSIDDPHLRKYTPKVYGVYMEPEREAYVLVMELLRNMTNMDSVSDISVWKKDHIIAVLDGAAEIHSIHYKKTEELCKKDWIGFVPDYKSMVDMGELWEALGVHTREEFPEWFSQRRFELHRLLVRNIPNWWKELDSYDRTLIHNDFNPRNIALRNIGDGFQLCVYDWELATVHLPQHDLAEFLVFVLPESCSTDEITHYIEYHRLALERYASTTIDPIHWRRGYQLCLYDLAVNRIAMYLMAHTFRHYDFMERIVNNLHRLIMVERRIRGNA
jgi:hydroxymethylglutaryl-CoA reductase (NADPH)